jgi:hypothetical protein
MIQIIPGDRAGADNLAEIVDPVCNTVMAAGPDAQVDCHSVAPENRMRVYVRRACVAHNIAGIDGACPAFTIALSARLMTPATNLIVFIVV